MSVPGPPYGPPDPAQPYGSPDPTGGDPAAAGPPVCPPHPDRVSYVRCQRCGRPTCPECQRPAAVGVHCVDCVREANRTAPRTRTVFGATVRTGRPVVTLTLIGACVVSFLLQLALGTTWEAPLIFSPALGEIEPWRYLTSAFLHSRGMLLHIVFNLYALWVLGQSLEPALGRWRFATLYALAALGGSVFVTLLATPGTESWFQGVVGASGAVFGLFGAMLVVLRRMGRSAQPIIVLLVVNLVIGFVVPGIAWQAHIGGLLVGVALGSAFAYAPRERRTAVAVGASVALAVVLVGLAVARSAGA